MGLIAKQGETLLYAIAANPKAAGMTTMFNCLCFDLGACIGWAMPPALLAMPFQYAVLRAT
jgi:hypothetical protein